MVTPKKAKPAAKKPVKSAVKSKAAVTKTATKRAVKRPVRTASTRGRKPLKEGEIAVGRSLRMPESYWAKIDKMGGVEVIRRAVAKLNMKRDRLRASA